MQQIVDINIFNDLPLNAFNFASEQAKEELNHYFQYWVYKYQLNDIEEIGTKILKKLPEGVLNPIKIDGFKKFSREELHER